MVSNSSISAPILVAVDFSVTTAPCLRHARAIAGDHGSVILLHVIDASLLPQASVAADLIEQCLDELLKEARAKLDALERDPALQGLEVETRIVRGRPAESIAEAARSASLVVVGAHARSTASRLFLGSVAEEVVRRSPRPVLVVRERAQGKKVERILLALDPADPVPEAIALASDLAKRTGARLEAIHVIPWPEEPGQEPNPKIQELKTRVVSAARWALKGEISKAVGESIQVRIGTGSPADKIVSYARPRDIVVCATHARGAIGRLTFGSVALKISRRAPCPVLLVPPGARTTTEVLEVATAGNGHEGV